MNVGHQQGETECGVAASKMRGAGWTNEPKTTPGQRQEREFFKVCTQGMNIFNAREFLIIQTFEGRPSLAVVVGARQGTRQRSA